MGREGSENRGGDGALFKRKMQIRKHYVYIWKFALAVAESNTKNYRHGKDRMLALGFASCWHLSVFVSDISRCCTALSNSRHIFEEKIQEFTGYKIWLQEFTYWLALSNKVTVVVSEISINELINICVRISASSSSPLNICNALITRRT